MNRAKLSKLIADKMNALNMTQEQFADYFSEISGNKVTYGFVQALLNPKKTSIPEYQNIRGIAKMYNVSLAELDLYLTDESIIDIKDISKHYKDMQATIKADPDDATDILLQNFEGKTLTEIGLRLVKEGLSQINGQLDRVEKLTEALKHMGLSQV